jgi:hypothetical protein
LTPVSTLGPKLLQEGFEVRLLHIFFFFNPGIELFQISADGRHELAASLFPSLLNRDITLSRGFPAEQLLLKFLEPNLV